jgi:hypothetical protein
MRERLRKGTPAPAPQPSERTPAPEAVRERVEKVAAPSVSREDWKLYEFGEGAMKLELPEGWRPAEPEDPDLPFGPITRAVVTRDFAGVAMGASAGTAVALQYVAEEQAEPDPGHLAIAIKLLTIRVLPGASLKSDTREIALGTGDTMITFAVTTNDTGEEQVVARYCVATRTRVYYLSFVCPEAEYDSQKAVMDEIARTLSW